MYKLVNVFVDSDAHGTFGFRAIVTQSAGCCYEGMEARNVLFSMMRLNDIFEMRLKGNTTLNAMVRLKLLVQSDDKFADGLYVNLRDCNKNAYSFVDLLRDDVTAGLDWRDITPTDGDDAAADDDDDAAVASEVFTVFGKLKIIATRADDGGVYYSPVLESQQFREIILRDFTWSFCIDLIKAHAECLLIQAMVAALYDSSYSTSTDITFEEGGKKGVLTTCVGKVHINDVVLYPDEGGRIYSCKLTLPWSRCGDVSLYNTTIDRLPVEIDLLIKKKINEFLNKIKFV